MFLLDTNVWIWLVAGNLKRLTPNQRAAIENEETGDAAENSLGICAISLWEVAKAVERKGLVLPIPVDEWLGIALRYPRLQVVPLTPEIVVESTRLPGTFHRDPADQLIVATARVLDVPLLTRDKPIRRYPHVRTI